MKTNQLKIGVILSYITNLSLIADKSFSALLLFTKTTLSPFF